LFEYWCYRQDAAVEDWLVQVARNSIPVVERHKFANRYVLGELLQVAETLVIPPTETPLPIIHTPAKNHPCLHLSEVFDSRYTPANCSGRCMHRKQTGKPCFWSGGIASQCDLFEAYKKSK